MDLAVHGVYPNIASKNMKPRDQTSLFEVYLSDFNIYGDIYNGVPTADVSISL